MALKIRLSRVGTKNEPHYRVVVAEERSRRDGDAVEQGAKPTATMHSMIKRAKRAAAAPAA
jgi:small subunit ribosomal protein S16